jgi:glycosyltransferase involved in cell wall biosynthesis
VRVGIDGLHLFGQYAGVKHALANLVTGLRATHPQDEIVLYVPRDFSGPPQPAGDPGLIVRKTWFPGRWRTIRTIWRNFRLQSRTYKDQCDLIHGPTYALPSMLSKPAVVTIHDVIALSHPLFCTPGSAKVQGRAIPRSIKAARRVIVPSLAAKTDVLRNVKEASESRIDVIPWGVGAEFKPLAQDKRAAARMALKLPEQYVLFVGNLEPKKNIPMLIRGFFAAKLHRKLPHKLVIAGQRAWGMESIERLIHELNAQEFVFFTDYVPQAALPAIYSLADLLVMPSLIEGFGMPVLEAMACGCPVLISTDPALQEVSASVARTIPYDSEKPLQPLREALEDLLLDNPAQRVEMTRRGIERAKLFTWEKTAELTRQSYAKAMEE